MKKHSRHRNWLDTVSKLLTGVGTVIASVFIPLAINCNSERNRSNQLYAQIVSERERADSELRAKMFENLINSFFTDDSTRKTGRQRLMLLRLLALNFHESFNLKPIFEGLEPELKKNEKEKLKEIAKEIIGTQEAALSQIIDGAVYEKTLFEGEENGIMVPADTEAAYNGHRLGVEATKIDTNKGSVELHVFDIPADNVKIGMSVDINFKASNYDMPFIDNTKLFNNTRFAVTLKQIGIDSVSLKNVVTLKIIFFPETYMSGRDRPYLDEMLEKIKQE